VKLEEGQNKQSGMCGLEGSKDCSCDMEGYESVGNWAFNHRENELVELEEEGIVLTGQRYVLAKLEAEYGAR
jgi:hypothetical protein